MRTPLQIVEDLLAIAGDDDEGRLAHYADDAEVDAVESERRLKGIQEIRGYAKELPPSQRPELRTCTIHEVGDRAVLLTTLAFTRTGAEGGTFTEIRPVGFIVTIQDERVKRIEAFDSWEQTRAAAGLPADSVGKRAAVSRRLSMAADSARQTLRILSSPPATAG